MNHGEQAGQVRWGILGAGGVARRRILPAFAEVGNGHPVALMDVASDILVPLSRQYEVPSFYTSLEDLLADPEIDAVYVASPVQFHHDQALRVIEADKHMLIEKPLASTVAEASSISEAAARRPHLVVRPAMSMRFHAGHKAIRHAIQNGELGPVVSARLQLSCLLPPTCGNWRLDPQIAGGGALMDMGVHCIDLISFLLDARPVSVMAVTDTTSPIYQVEDRAVLLLEMSNGAVVTIDNYYSVPDQAVRNCLEIYGHDGGILADRTLGQEPDGTIQIWSAGSEIQHYESHQTRTATPWHDLPFVPTNQYSEQLISFNERVLGLPLHSSSANEGPTVADGLHVLQTVAGAYRSHSRGRRIRL